MRCLRYSVHTWWTVALLFVAGIVCAQDYYAGKTFRVTGEWIDGELRANRIQLREEESDPQRVQVIARIDSVDVLSRQLRLGLVRMQWDAKTEFKGLQPSALTPGTLIRVSGRAKEERQLIAASVQAYGAATWGEREVQLTGEVAASKVAADGAGQLHIASVPIRLEGAGYNRVESLTQRQDSRRPEQPLRVDIAGRPLIITGEYTATLRERDGFRLDDNKRSNFDQEASLEMFVPLRPNISLFAELKGFYERDLRRTDGGERRSDSGIARGQTWIFVDGLARRRMGLQIGRQNFKETREWWWDDDRDAARVYFDEGPFHAELALARELARESSDEDGIDPSEQGVTRLIGHGSWLWAPRQAFEVYALRQNDGSSRPALGSTLRESREDGSDADLTWLGVRAIGQRALERAGTIKYWADFGMVRGRETRLDYDDASAGRSVVADRFRRDVRGQAIDVGISWQTPLPAQPAFTLGYATGSGGREGDSTDKNFRQTGLHNNKGRFFGVNRFRYYGELLRPELSNLSVATAAVGVPFWNRSSVELVYHRYRQRVASTSMRDIRIDADLTGASRDLGEEFDLVLGFREGARFDTALIASTFKAGRAFGSSADERAYLWLLEVTYNF